MNPHLLRLMTVSALQEVQERIATLPDPKPADALCPRCSEELIVELSRRTAQWFVLHPSGRECELAGRALHRLGVDRAKAVEAWREMTL
jgi:hypothetical protein